MKTFDPGMAGIAHDATGLGDLSTFCQLLLYILLTSTRHIRQLPAIARRSW